ncbi:MAG: phosphoribosyl-AMP cyclohydrolase [Hydrogenibacillus schlegelii]|nr:phosphoribosyl-AMP cyclohydrolase [Hydrogenibacillus schlegelii]
MIRPGDVRFGPDGLIPAVLIDARTKDVLTLAYMNEAALKKTLETGETWLYSRSRRALWHKGATSGHRQTVVDLKLDCDGDALLVSVIPHGPACHTGAPTCFHRPLAARTPDGRLAPAGGLEERAEAERTAEAKAAAEPVTAADAKAEAHPATDREAPTVSAGALSADGYGALGRALGALSARIEARRHASPEASYTAYLLAQGRDKILKKLAEEAAEVLLAAKDGRPEALTEEVADLLYHLAVLFAETGLSPAAVAAVLETRARPAADAFVPRSAGRSRRPSKEDGR